MLEHVDWSFILVACLIMVLGSALQSAAGFAFGMFAIPMLILFGSTPQDAITILSVNGLTQTIIGIYHLRRHVRFRQVAVLIVIASTLVPLGVLALGRLSQAIEPTAIRQVFGGLILTVILVQAIVRITPRETLHWIWTVLAMTICGFVAGLSGMGGPPAVMWVMAHKWSNERSRATLWMLFAGLTPVQWFFLHQRFGDSIVHSMGLGAMLIPLTLLGMVPGLWIGRHLTKQVLRRLAYVILIAVAAYAIASPWLSSSDPASQQSARSTLNDR